MVQPDLPLVLIVDDQRLNITLLQRLLEKHYRLKSATSGPEALDLLAQEPFDLVLLDIMMPKMNGLQVLQEIRSNPITADTPVILVSAMAEVQNIVGGLDAGANDYITKPFDPDVTLARVKTQITLKCLQDERKQTIEELRTAQEMKDRMLKIASHDLKGPLGNISMVAYLLRQAQDQIEDGPRLLDTLEHSLAGMHTIIKDFLDTAAIQSGALDIQLDYVVVAHLLEALTTEHEAFSLKKGITLNTVSSDGIILADVSRFRQVLDNLISNAIKYSPANTTVRLGTECYDSKVRIYVADQGPGIPAVEQDRLFTEFGKLSPRPTAGESSTGLGLWIVKHLVTLQKGRVGVECPPEGGSVFWVEMPRVNGYEALTILKTYPRFSHIPVVAYTVHISEMNAAFELGFDAFIGKPISAEAFPEQLKQILHGEKVCYFP
ncbi:MAG TPA: response regulator [Phototrophicaceae bacterium]|nr:response regulator [Phototrophicaceae bacterium]